MFYLFRPGFTFEYSNTFNQSAVCTSWLIITFQSSLQVCWIDLYTSSQIENPSFEIQVPKVSVSPLQWRYKSQLGMFQPGLQVSYFIRTSFHIGELVKHRKSFQNNSLEQSLNCWRNVIHGVNFHTKALQTLNFGHLADFLCFTEENNSLLKKWTQKLTNVLENLTHPNGSNHKRWNAGTTVELKSQILDI